MTHTSSLFLIFGVLTLSSLSFGQNCNWPSVAGSDGLCYSGADGDCTTSADCMPGGQLVCTLGKCQCRNPVNMWYDSTINSCGINLGLPCVPNHPTDICGKQMSCSPINNSSAEYSCQCGAGQLGSLDGTGCFKGYMEACSGTYECSYMGMSGGRGFSCRQGKCQCGNEPAQVWDDAQKVCGGVEGTKCSLTYSGLPCKSGLTCVKMIGLSDGVCRAPAPVTTSAPATTSAPVTTKAPTTVAPATTVKATTKKATG